ncbi:hypothetical protein [Flavobacterium yafengii]|uniref:hypothetical protein n=1 Tax=Flavobacterium yafengii TaxID=3041253 RepID=UPI0024A89472|nr:hypothetical protein [Flavobacterium yafengii]MDI5898747.1 hypothetical protein [Flavobacterium yafengii]
MGFFKSIGSKLKRVVSVKNLVNGVTGNFSAIGSDVVRVMKTEDPKKKPLEPVNQFTSKTFSIPQPVTDILEAQDKLYQTNLVKSVASIPVVQDVNTIMSKLWIQSQWLKYKNWIVGFGAVLSCFLLWKFVFSKKQNQRKRR